MQPSNLVLVGVIATSHGVRGQLKIRSFTSIPEDIAAYSPLTDKTGTRIFGLRIIGHAKDTLIATLEGVTTKEQADALRGIELYASATALPALNENEFYVRDLVGMQVELENRKSFGTVKHVHDFGAGPLLEIALANGSGTEMLPFLTSIFPVIDMTKRVMTIDPPEYITVEETGK